MTSLFSILLYMNFILTFKCFLTSTEYATVIFLPMDWWSFFLIVINFVHCASYRDLLSSYLSIFYCLVSSLILSSYISEILWLNLLIVQMLKGGRIFLENLHLVLIWQLRFCVISLYCLVKTSSFLRKNLKMEQR